MADVQCSTIQASNAFGNAFRIGDLSKIGPSIDLTAKHALI